MPFRTMDYAAWCLVAFAVGAANADDALKTVLDAHENNRTAFPFGVARFEYSIGTASSLADAESTSWKPTKKGTGRYAFRGDSLYFEILYPEKVLRESTKKVGKNQYSPGDVECYRISVRGKLRMFDIIGGVPDVEGLIHSPRIDENPLPTQDVVFPLCLGFKRHQVRHLVADLAGMIGRLNPQVSLRESDGRERFRGVDCRRIVIESPKTRHEYLVDMMRGAIPLRYREVAVADEKPLLEIGLDDLRSVGGRGWIPHRETILVGGRVKRIDVTSIDCEKVPDDAEFAMEFPAPLPLVNSFAKVKYPPSKVWNLESLPADNGPGVQKVVLQAAPMGPMASGPVDDLEAEAASQRRFFWNAAAASAVGIFAACATLVYLARRFTYGRKIH